VAKRTIEWYLLLANNTQRRSKSEVEFLLSTDLGIVPLEVKSGRVTHSKSLGVFEARYHPERSYVLSARNIECKGKRCLTPIYAVGTVERNLANRTPKL
jgi:hypothetical protein